MSHFVKYILWFQEIIVCKIPPVGEGVYSQPKVYYQKISIILVSEKYFPHSGPILVDVAESSPIPVAVWLHIYLININILRKEDIAIQKKIFEIAL